MGLGKEQFKKCWCCWKKHQTMLYKSLKTSEVLKKSQKDKIEEFWTFK